MWTTIKFYATYDAYVPTNPTETTETSVIRPTRIPPNPRDAKVFQQCQHDAKAKLPDLKKVYSWRAPADQRAADDIAVLTQLSVERLSMLRNQCRVWPQEINAVVYVPHMENFGVISDDVPALNGTTLADVAHLVDGFYRDLEKDGLCRLNMDLVVEEFDHWDDPMKPWSLYPTNSLRNRALMMAKTDAVILLDVDFLPSRELAEMYSGNKYWDLMNDLDQKVAYVLPAFETANSGTEGVLLANRVAVEGKEAMVAAFDGGDIVGFQVEQYFQGHGPDNFPKWVVAEEPYPIRYKKGYEPYLLMSRRFVPWFDERMRGYSRNKIVQVNLLAEQLGVSLRGHDRGFVVHAPHPKASNFKATKETGQWETLLELYINIRRDISLGEFVPVVSFARNKKVCGRTVSAGELGPIIRKKLKERRSKRADAKLRKQVGE